MWTAERMESVKTSGPPRMAPTVMQAGEEGWGYQVEREMRPRKSKHLAFKVGQLKVPS